METISPAWGVFFLVVLVLMALDLGVLRRRDAPITLRQSLWLSGFYILISLLFGGWVYVSVGAQAGKDFLTGYVIEKSLSLDNIFIMSLVFKYLAISPRFQSPVLFWGVFGVIILRGLLIGAGEMLIHEFHPVLYLFGALLVYSGIKMLLMREEKPSTLDDNRLLAWLRRHVPVTKTMHGKKFFAREHDATTGKLHRRATPLFLALLFIELADVVFALDSVPAVFGVTTDGFVVYTSNIFAVLGLRALYFALTAFLARFVYLHLTLACILIFIGAKIFLPLAELHMSSNMSLAVTLGLLALGIIASLLKQHDAKQSHHEK